MRAHLHVSIKSVLHYVSQYVLINVFVAMLFSTLLSGYDASLACVVYMDKAGDIAASLTYIPICGLRNVAEKGGRTCPCILTRAPLLDLR